MIRDSYTAAEWRTMQMAFFWVHLAVANADGKIDKKETEAFTTEIKKWILSSDPLVRELTATFSLEAQTVLSEMLPDGRGAAKGLSDVADILDRKATLGQAKEFKATLLLIGHNIAKASGGGVFGIGEKISPEEKTALQVLVLALRATDVFQS